MKPFAMPSDLHAALKARSAETGATMTDILRAALASHLDRPDLSTTTDARIRGAWYVNLFVWSAAESLEASSGPYKIPSTGDLPQLATDALRTPELEALVRADLPRLRQVLARVQSTSARIPLGDGRVCQIDVHREMPL